MEEASKHRKKSGAVSSMDLAWFEGSDFLADMEISLPNKRRHRGRVVDTESGKLDVHYLKFLDGLEDFWEAKFVGDGEEDDSDPTYMDFLDHLREHGNAYVCDVSVENGVLSPIVYDEGDCFPNESMRKTARMCIDSNDDRKMWKLKQDGDVKLGRKNYNAKNKFRGELRKSVDVVDKRRSRVKNPDFGDDCAHVLKDKWKTTISSKDNHAKRNRSVDVDGDQRSSPICSGLEKKTSNVVDEVYEKFMQNLHVKGEDVFWEYGDHGRIYFEPRYQYKTVFEKRKRPQASTPASKLPSPPPKTQFTPWSSQKKSTMRDLENTCSAYNKILEDEEQIIETRKDYKEELREYLRMPYDQEEYDNLLEIMSARKPMSIHKETRSGGFDQEGPLGKSYLDRYEDLKIEIKNAGLDRSKVLNLLRMCKYFLQKAPSLGGCTVPWKDDSFKTILPGSSYES